MVREDHDMTTQIPATTSEKLEVFIAADADPTAATLKFAATTGPGVTPQPASWTAGTWATYTAADGGATALTPLIGSATATPAADIAVTAGVWRLWAQVTTGTETPVIDLGLIDVV